MTLAERKTGDVDALVATAAVLLGDGDYTPQEMRELWDEVNVRVDEFISERVLVAKEPSL